MADKFFSNVRVLEHARKLQNWLTPLVFLGCMHYNFLEDFPSHCFRQFSNFPAQFLQLQSQKHKNEEVLS